MIFNNQNTDQVLWSTLKKSTNWMKLVKSKYPNSTVSFFTKDFWIVYNTGTGDIRINPKQLDMSSVNMDDVKNSGVFKLWAKAISISSDTHSPRIFQCKGGQGLYSPLQNRVTFLPKGITAKQKTVVKPISTNATGHLSEVTQVPTNVTPKIDENKSNLAWLIPIGIGLLSLG
jgi:hypothetical protein